MLANGKVWKYASSTLRRLVREAASTRNVQISAAALEKRHIILYLDGYLNLYCRERTNRAHTIVVETEYIDKDFMREYSGYYSSSFLSLPKKTTRLHFFRSSFTQLQFDKWVTENRSGAPSPLRSKLQRDYLGFCVVRPLPTSYIGRTCLRTYPEKKHGKRRGETRPEWLQSVRESRKYPVQTNYPVNLFGLKLSVHSVAFQEQDGIVGVCASSALYSMIHGCRRRFDIKPLSALEITNIANESMPALSEIMTSGGIFRSLPNTGLTFEQMTHVLAQVGVQPIAYFPRTMSEDRAHSLALLYAYLSAGLPILVYVKLVEEGSVTEGSDEITFMDSPSHAFLITGFGIAQEIDRNVVISDPDLPRLIGHRINKVYVHDDRVGPFARYEASRLDNNTCLAFKPRALARQKGKTVEYVHPYVNRFGEATEMMAVPFGYLIPAGDKLRMPFERIVWLAGFLEKILTEMLGQEESSYAWDLRVGFVDQFRDEIGGLRADQLEPSRKLELLKRDLPRVIWRLRAVSVDSDVPVLEIVVDATSTHLEAAIVLITELNSEGLRLLTLLYECKDIYWNSYRRLPEAELVSSLLSKLRP